MGWSCGEKLAFLLRIDHIQSDPAQLAEIQFAVVISGRERIDTLKIFNTFKLLASCPEKPK